MRQLVTTVDVPPHTRVAVYPVEVMSDEAEFDDGDEVLSDDEDDDDDDDDDI